MFWASHEDAVKVWRMCRNYRKGLFYEDWIDRLAIMGVIEEEDYHRENGKIFNIPKCCREWFIYLMCSVKVEDPLLATDRTYGDDELQEKFWYVRCPTCRMLSDRRIVNE